jgi:TM2 domain-containing membrane protein YozV
VKAIVACDSTFLFYFIFLFFFCSFFGVFFSSYRAGRYDQTIQNHLMPFSAIPTVQDFHKQEENIVKVTFACFSVFFLFFWESSDV